MKQGFSIVIPTYNRARLLADTLNSIGQLEIPADFAVEVVVIDNNCTDETHQMVETAARHLPFSLRRVVEANQGLCHCRNRGIEEALYDLIVYLDDDVLVSHEWLAGFSAVIEADGADCVVGPVQPVFETPFPSYLESTVTVQLTSPYSRRGDVAFRLPADIAHQIPGCNFGVQRGAAIEAGGFDCGLDRCGEGLTAGGDWDFGKRLLRAGKKTVYEPRCGVSHVLTAEKLNAAYLRKRLCGLGRTKRLMEEREGTTLSSACRWRHILGIAWLSADVLFSRVFLGRARAFEKQMLLCKQWGYVFCGHDR